MSEKLNNTIVGEELAEYVQNQITTRQKIHGSGVDSLRTPEQLNYLNSKTAWVKLASGTYLQPEKLYNLGFSYEAVKKFVGIGLAQNHILFGGYASLSSTGQLEALDTGSYQKTINEIQQNNPEQFKISGAGTFDVNQRTEFLGNNIKGAYLTGEDFGIVPMPGIESLDVKALNRGSLKKAIVKIKAQDRNQLAILDVLYLRLGYTVLLEWGNSVYLDNQSNLQQLTDTILENDQLFFNRDWNQDKAYDDILQYIENYRETYAGNYDGLLGKVSNFNWSFNKDGSYDVELTILSYGDIIESLKTNVTAPKDTYDLVLNQFTSDLRGKIVEDHRTDNIIFTYLKTFQIVSGSAGSINTSLQANGYTVGSGSYGWLLPDIGTILLNPLALTASVANGGLALNTNRSNNTDGQNTTRLYAAISGGASFTMNSQETITADYIFVRPRSSEFNYSENPSYISGSTGEVIYDNFINNPTTYITTVGLYNDTNDLLAVAKLSRPLKKDFTKETLIRVKLDF